MDNFFFLAETICDCRFIGSFFVYYAAVKPAGLGLVCFGFVVGCLVGWLVGFCSFFFN